MKRRAWLAASILGLLPLACGEAVVSTTGSGGTTGTTGTTGTGGNSGAGGAAGAGGSGGNSAGTGGACGDCQGFDCCGTTCVNLKNDIKNCGKCGAVCAGPDPYCNEGTCGAAPCDPTSSCMAGKLCCGTACCNTGELCCNVPGPVGEMLQCAQPTAEGTCPKGCVMCKCTSPDTPIATPSGDRPIAELVPGDLVYSVRDQATVAVPILRVTKVSVHDHHVVHVALETGAVLEVSPTHPTADGRMFGDLRPGDRLDGARVLEARLIPYAHSFTHDILPDSGTGTYFAGGALIGSTMYGPVNVGHRAAE